MKFTAIIDEEHQVSVPEEILRTFDLAAGSRIDLEICKPLDGAERLERARRLEAVLDKYQGSMREQMLAEGYSSVEELMNEVRPPW